eukprot:403376635
MNEDNINGVFELKPEDMQSNCSDKENNNNEKLENQQVQEQLNSQDRLTSDEEHINEQNQKDSSYPKVIRYSPGTVAEEEWIVDHTGIKRKPFKVMHRELKELLKGKIVVMHNLNKDFSYLRLTRHDCLRTVDTSLLKMFQRKNLKRKLRDLVLEYLDEKIQKTINHSPIEDARACMRLYKVFTRELKIYPVKIIYNPLYGSKEARYKDPSDIKNSDEITGQFTDCFKLDNEIQGDPNESQYVALAYNWAVNEADEREILRVTVVNEKGLLLFDSVVQPSKIIKYAPLFNMYLYDPSFGIPLKYLAEMLNIVLDKKVVIGYQLNKLFSCLNLSCVYTLRDIIVNDSIGINSTYNLAKTFFDINFDKFFRSTINEARLFLVLYKSFQSEIDDYYLKYSIVEDLNEYFQNDEMEQDLQQNMLDIPCIPMPIFNEPVSMSIYTQ